MVIYMIKRFTAICVFGILLIMPIVSGNQANEISIGQSFNSGLVFHADAIDLSPSTLLNLNDKISIEANSIQESTMGYTLFNTFSTEEHYQIIINRNGEIVAGTDKLGNVDIMTAGPEFIDSNTILGDNGTHLIIWNIETNEFDYVHYPNLLSHHDFEYNTISDTFLILGTEISGSLEVNGEMVGVAYDTITEIDRGGDILWQLNFSQHIPVDTDLYYILNKTTSTRNADWMHGNSIFWDIDEDVIYYNSAYLSSFYKIDKVASKIDWGLGYYADNFTLFDINGVEVPSLFFGAHSLEKIGDNKFIIYDNNKDNLVNPLSTSPKFLEIEVDELLMEARVSWSWPGYGYKGPILGDVDHLPNHNRLGTFIGGYGISPTFHQKLIEVNETGGIVWEAEIENLISYRAERFFESPVMNIDEASLSSIETDTFVVNLSVWNSYKERTGSDGSIEIYDKNKEVLYLEKEFSYLPYWQGLPLSLSIPTEDMKSNTKQLIFVLKNSDGLETVLLVDLYKDTSAIGWSLGLSTLVLLAFVIKKRKVRIELK